MSFFGPISSPLLDEANTPLVRRALQRARVVGSFAFVQAVVQVISFGSGILIIRALQPREYAYFTIANTMQGTINVLADIGIGVGLVSIGGRVWQDRHRFGQLIQTALGLRRKLGLVAVLVITPLLYSLLVKNGASLSYALILTVLVLAGLAVQLTMGVVAVVPRLHSETGRIQTIDLTGALARLFVLLALFFLFLNAGVAVAVGSAALLLQYLMLKRYATQVVNFSAPENEDDRIAIRGFIRNQAANVIFYCLQGQITVFLISIFSHHADSVAEVGALGRLAAIFTVLGNLLTNVFAPAFARCQGARRLRRLYLAIVSAVGAFGFLILMSAILFPKIFLFVLGGSYAHLDRELVLMVASSVVGSLAATFWALNSAKAWVKGSWLYIPMTLATQVALIPFTDFTQVRSVLLFNLISLLPNLLFNLALGLRGLYFAPRTEVA